MAGPDTLNFDDANFDAEVLKADQPVLVDFWAEWCPPCIMLGPTIDEIATEYAGKVRVGKVDIDKAPQTAMKFNVQNIPTVILFEAGKPTERLMGAQNKREYKRILDARVGESK
ncbi:MAG: thioredoxin [Phycisphaerales bacterium]|nr:thioredoxin [Phycisphaerales bacterium]